MRNYFYIIAFLLALSPALRAVKLSSRVIHLQAESIHPKDLPEAIRKHITTHYSGARILTARKIQDASGAYEVIIDFEEAQISLFFDSNGKFLRKSV